MSADNRSVQTDALAALGTLIPDTVGRDAIHLAVEPVIAGDELQPGERITFFDGDTTTAVREDAMSTGPALGIVDPFLRQPVQPGQRFLMVLLPGQIATLRHVWDHPAFPPAQAGGVDLGVPPAAKPTSDAKEWLRDFARQNHVPYDDLIRDAISWSNCDAEPWWWSNTDADYDTFWSMLDELLGIRMERGEIDLSCQGC
jgi:hypothetical protein